MWYQSLPSIPNNLSSPYLIPNPFSEPSAHPSPDLLSQILSTDTQIFCSSPLHLSSMPHHLSQPLAFIPTCYSSVYWDPIVFSHQPLPAHHHPTIPVPHLAWCPIGSCWIPYYCNALSMPNTLLDPPTTAMPHQWSTPYQIFLLLRCPIDDWCSIK